MQKIAKPCLLFVLITLAVSCTNNTGNDLKAKKANLEKLQAQRDDLEKKIASLQADIAKTDTSTAVEQKPKLVALTTLAMQPFQHYLELQGTVDSKNISYITPTGQGGQVKAIYVKQGDHVRQGQLVLKLDDEVAAQNVIAVKQQMGSVKAQLDLAKDLYQRQKNLWDQHIGTEVQLLQDKTNVENLENQLSTIQANVNAAQAQANQSNVYSNINGVVDDITVHVGETFNGNPVQGGYIRIVNDANLKVSVNVPENYAAKVNKGTPVTVEIPDIDKSFNGNISFLSQSIGVNTRGYTAEVQVPSNVLAKPNQVAVVKILDYSVPTTIAVNVNTLQTDEQGKFVLIAAKEGNKLVARKRKVTTGELSGDIIEIKDGLKAGDQLITDGYQSLFDGQAITTSAGV